MKNLTIVCAILLAALFATACFAKDTQPNLQKQAKITKEQATAIALAKVPNGTVKEAELEKEKGKLVWSFDIATLDTKDITEVLVDAKSGDIVAVDKETPEDQAREQKQEQKKK